MLVARIGTPSKSPSATGSRRRSVLLRGSCTLRKSHRRSVLATVLEPKELAHNTLMGKVCYHVSRMQEKKVGGGEMGGGGLPAMVDGAVS